MAYLAKVDGIYRFRVRAKILWFWVVYPWQSQAFAWQQVVNVPELHLSYSPVKGVPVSLALDADETGAHFGIKVSGGPALWGEPVHVPAGVGQAFRFEPWKGVIVEGTASFT